eukprot:jgi/Psemu1/182594/e_gw1.26.93.1
MTQARTLTGFVLFVITTLSCVDALASSSSRRAFLSQMKITGTAFFVAGSTPQVVNAYERRDVGEEGSRSAATAAFNEQAFKTNNRLEAEGFKLDTVEEDKAKLSAAMASFSYESTTSTKKKTGYGSIPSKSSTSGRN